MLRQRHAGQGELQQRAVIAGIAHQDGAEERLAVAGHHQLLVDDLVGVDVAQRVRDAAVRIADRGHVHAHELQLGAHVGAEELHGASPARCRAATSAIW